MLFKLTKSAAIKKLSLLSNLLNPFNISAFALFTCCAPNQVLAEAPPPSLPGARDMIVSMKNSPRGPFSSIRWFCNDGSVLPAKAGCSKHGGGRQHGKWSEDTVKLRDSGYQIATVYAELDQTEIERFSRSPRTIAQLLLERYLVARDNGWIYRQAKNYRGAVQIEDEIEGANRLLRSLLAKRSIRNDYYLILREAARLLPRTAQSQLVSDIRNQAARLASKDRTGLLTLETRYMLIPMQAMPILSAAMY